MLDFSSSFHWLWFLLAISISAVISYSFYFYKAKDDFSQRQRLLLASLRFLALSIIWLLLFSPALRQWKSSIEKPIILFAVDNSKSMILGKEPEKKSAELEAIFENTVKKLQEKYEVRLFEIGSTLQKFQQLNFNQSSTNLQLAMEQMIQQNENRNVGAILLMSDGIYNEGKNPIFTADASPYPIYVLKNGDTNSYKDLRIKELNFNRNVFLNNSFPLDILIESEGVKGAKAWIKIINQGKIIGSQQVVFEPFKKVQKVNFVLEAKTEGTLVLDVILDKLDGEVNTANNRRKILVDVVGQKSKILIAYQSPHPDVAALQNALSKMDEYEVDVAQFNLASNLDFLPYQLIILHQLPEGNSRSIHWARKAIEAQKPILFILGSQSNVQSLNSLNIGIQISAKQQGQMIESTALIHPDFNLFSLPAALNQSISELPPLSCVNGDFQLSNSAQKVLNQQIGSVKTQNPMLCIMDQSGYRSALLAGEGLWKWRMYFYLQNQSHEAFDSFWLKMLRYISSSKKYQRFDLLWEPIYAENDEVIFNATVYTSSYEASEDAKIELTIRDAEGKSFPFTFSNSKGRYTLNAGSFAAGNYSFEAKATLGKEVFVKKGSFNIEDFDLEEINTKANFQLLDQMAASKNGLSLPSSQWQSLADSLIERKDIVDKIHQHQQFTELINLPWFLLILVVLLSAEWFLRKYFGSY